MQCLVVSSICPQSQPISSSPPPSMSNSNITIYDDSGGQVDYVFGDWYPLTGGNNTWQNGTLTGVNFGAAAFTFAFSGSRVSVYGSLRGENYTLQTPTESIYIIDDVVKQSYIAPQVTVDQNKLLFFDSGDIGEGDHSLLVSITDVTDSPPYHFDFLAVLHSSSPEPAQTSSVAPHVELGTIVGGVVGGMLVLMAGLVGMYLFCRKRKKSVYTRDINNNSDVVDGGVMQGVGATMGNSALGVTPYMLPRDYGMASAPMVPQQTAAPLAPGSISGTPTGVQTGPSEKVRLAQVLSPFADPPFQPDDNSSRDLYGSDRNTRFPSPVLPEYTADIPNNAASGAELARSLNFNEALSRLQPTPALHLSASRADFWMRLSRRTGGDSSLSSGKSEALPPYSAR